VASYNGLESCGATRKDDVEALTEESAGWVLSRENMTLLCKQQALQGADALEISGRQHRVYRYRKVHQDPARSNPKHAWNDLAREPGDPTSVGRRVNCRPCREVEGRTLMTNGRGKSDSSKVSTKPPNNAEGTAAEAVERRGLAKGNSPE